MRPKPCGRCKKHRKKCSLERPSCSRCLRKNVLCEYDEGWDEFYEKRVKDTDVKVATSTSASPQAMDFDLPATTSFILTMAILSQFIQSHPFKYRHSFCSVDPVSIVENFWTEAPELRLLYCAIAATMTEPRQPAQVCFYFYDRAQKALSYSEYPRLKTVQALIVGTNFALLSGQPMVGMNMFAKACNMAMALRLDVDPDCFGSEGNPLNLSEWGKEERRRVYWMLRYSYKIITMSTSVVLPPVPDCHKLKPIFGNIGNQLSSPLTPELTSPVVYLCSLLNILGDIGDFTSLPPRSLEDVLTCETYSAIKNRLMIWLSTIPPSFHLNPMNINVELNGIERSGLLNLMSFSKAAICALNRPLLYLTAFFSPDLIGEVATKFLTSRVFESLNNAQEITALNSAMLRLTIPGFNHKLISLSSDSSFWKEHMLIYLGYFEAVATIWFFVVKTQPCWRRRYFFDSMAIESAVVEKLLDGVADILKMLGILESGLSGHDSITSRPEKANMMTPLYDCVEGMLDEMKRVVAKTTTKDGVTKDEMTLLAMEVSDLGIDVDVHERVIRPPWVFLGLLGAKVNGGLQLYRPGEKEWEVFWNEFGGL
ncbi:hypothetical protein BCR33DRAFT_779815 [Rhizoclosmatium globosum]|uniref:Zn(2)-C6 fungal-type domain-containing protein n=1 Tax=Rhizoclosmatium globosum TaxID=329046 RepID=A0A1Y2CZT3_9FUNG|nr:hypothetical protein BCR33DRAFT_779815 [Rhizoclosmatium globosum]|eukprot:ORY52541.1 hypothetical protein BCR33DRAFT_779815 [Rhizoclosmatium globosum]